MGYLFSILEFAECLNPEYFPIKTFPEVLRRY